MRTKYQINTDSIEPPKPGPELALFTCAINSKTLRDALGAMGHLVPDKLELTHNTNPDDPPDIEALGLGWECTEFPPNQSALTAIHEKWIGGPMNVPGFSETGRNLGEMRRLADPNRYGNFYSVDGEIEALKTEFLETVIGGAKSKDVSCNHVLLLDHRQQPHLDNAETAIRKALSIRKPKHIQLVLLVGWQRILSTNDPLAPNLKVLYSSVRTDAVPP